MSEHSRKLTDVMESIRRRNANISEEIFNLLYSESSSSQDFKIIEDLDNRTIFIVWGDGKRLDLKHYVPKGFCFKQGIEFACNLWDKEIFYEPNLLDKKFAILGLFHEIGHANESLFYLAYQILRSWFDIPPKIFYLLLSSRFIAKIANCDIVAADKIAEDLPSSSLIPVLYVQRYHADSAKLERRATMRALKKLRELQKQGYNVFSGFAGMAEMQRCNCAALTSYELSYQMDVMNNLYVLFPRKDKPADRIPQLVYSRSNNKFLRYLIEKNII